MTVANPTLFYPKVRDGYRKYFRIARTDSATVKCVLPKGAIIVGVTVTQDAVAVTAAGAFNLGSAAVPTGLLNAFSMPTTSVGQVGAGTAAGATLIAGVALTTDTPIISTYTVGSTTAGGTGYVQVLYFMPGPSELLDD